MLEESFFLSKNKKGFGRVVKVQNLLFTAKWSVPSRYCATHCSLQVCFCMSLCRNKARIIRTSYCTWNKIHVSGLILFSVHFCFEFLSNSAKKIVTSSASANITLR